GLLLLAGGRVENEDRPGVGADRQQLAVARERQPLDAAALLEAGERLGGGDVGGQDDAALAAGAGGLAVRGPRHPPARALVVDLAQRRGRAGGVRGRAEEQGRGQQEGKGSVHEGLAGVVSMIAGNRMEGEYRVLSTRVNPG